MLLCWYKSDPNTFQAKIMGSIWNINQWKYPFFSSPESCLLTRPWIDNKTMHFLLLQLWWGMISYNQVWSWPLISCYNWPQWEQVNVLACHCWHELSILRWIASISKLQLRLKRHQESDRNRHYRSCKDSFVLACHPHSNLESQPHQ